MENFYDTLRLLFKIEYKKITKFGNEYHFGFHKYSFLLILNSRYGTSYNKNSYLEN